MYFYTQNWMKIGSSLRRVNWQNFWPGKKLKDFRVAGKKKILEGSKSKVVASNCIQHEYLLDE